LISFLLSALTYPDFSTTGCKTLFIEGPSGPAKTGLIATLVSWLAAQGWRPAVARFSPELDLGDAGKDTWKFRRAGANPVTLAAPGLLQTTSAIDTDADVTLFQVLTALAPYADLILVEGLEQSFLTQEPGASLELGENPGAIALVSQEPVAAIIPVFQPHQIEELGRHILNRLDFNGRNNG
jgi:molybdopterin-guanine dinucleotide biosynthesis protein MobB